MNKVFIKHSHQLFKTTEEKVGTTDETILHQQFSQKG